MIIAFIILLLLIPLTTTEKDSRKVLSFKGGLQWVEENKEGWTNLLTLQETPIVKLKKYFVRKTPSSWILSINYLPSQNKVLIKHRIQENTIQLPMQNWDSRWRKYLRVDLEFASNEFNVRFNKQIDFKVHDTIYTHWNVSRSLKHLSRYFRIVEDSLLDSQVTSPSFKEKPIKLNDFSPNTILKNRQEEEEMNTDPQYSKSDSEVSSHFKSQFNRYVSDDNYIRESCLDNSEKILSIIIDLKKLVDNLQRSLQIQYKEIQSLSGMMLLYPSASARRSCADLPCFPGVECEDGEPGEGYSCGSCPSSMMGDGHTCRRILCSDEPCFHGVECYDSYGGGFSCGNCPEGLTGDGTKEGCAVSESN